MLQMKFRVGPKSERFLQDFAVWTPTTSGTPEMVSVAFNY